MNPRIHSLVSKARLLKSELWRYHSEPLPRGKSIAFSFARIAAITFSGIKENRILARAAALSFSSLLGLGPLVALMVLISGFALGQIDPSFTQDTIERVVSYIAPQVTLSTPDGELNPEGNELSSLITQFITASQSGAVGLGGALILILIVIQLFTSVEDTFNDIWGVPKGRKLVTRVILYWTIITLGTVLFFAGIAFAVSELMKLNQQFAAFTSGLPGSETVNSWLENYGAKVGIFILVSTILSLFYRFIPNTQVEWQPAFIGALFTVGCFIANKNLAFLYIERVAMQRSLYGSLSILPILMIGLYTFWLCLLMGGRLSFAVQNARFRSGKVAWAELSQASQESLCLLLLAQISRQFQQQGKALSNTQLAKQNNIPRPLAGAALVRLSELNLASELPAEEHDAANDYRYQPARPLEQISLLEFKRSFESYGKAPSEDLFDSRDPIVKHYHDLISKARSDSFQQLTLAQAIKDLENQS